MLAGFYWKILFASGLKCCCNLAYVFVSSVPRFLPAATEKHRNFYALSDSSVQQQLTAPVETNKLVPVTHYDVSVTSQLAKNI